MEIKGIYTSAKFIVNDVEYASIQQIQHLCNLDALAGSKIRIMADKSLNLSKWNTAKADNMVRMFGRCKSLTNLDLSNIDISNVITMKEMFINCSDELVIEGISSWDLTDVF